jgi:hypothetical protein
MVSTERVWEGIQALTVEDLIRLKRFVGWRIRWVGRKALGRDERDLLSEAVIATATGKRVWAEDVSLLTHLLGAVRSISSSWRAKRGEEYLESELARTGAESPFERILTTENPESILMAKERAEQVNRLFENDWIASHVIRLLAGGYTSKEVRDNVGLTATEYSTVTKRIRRKVERELTRPRPRRSRKRATVGATPSVAIRVATKKLVC